MAAHDLKIWPEYFEAMCFGGKNFEVRFNDRDFHKGDVLQLREYDPEQSRYTGREIQRRVTYVLRNFSGLQHGYCVLAVEDV